MNTEGRYLFLRAIRENWGLIGPGDLITETYSIFSDGSFSLEKKYNPSDFDRKPLDDFLNEDTITIEGYLNQSQMEHVIELLSEDWKNPDIDSFSCDGEAWQIKQYYPSGKTKKTTGEVQQIYGQPIERLADYIWQVCK